MRLYWCARGYDHHAHHALLRSLYSIGALPASVPASVFSFLFRTKLCQFWPLRLFCSAPLRLCSTLLCATLSLSLLCSSGFVSASALHLSPTLGSAFHSSRTTSTLLTLFKMQRVRKNICRRCQTVTHTSTHPSDL